jgi:hypothetical protein
LGIIERDILPALHNGLLAEINFARYDRDFDAQIAWTL